MSNSNIKKLIKSILDEEVRIPSRNQLEFQKSNDKIGNPGVRFNNYKPVVGAEYLPTDREINYKIVNDKEGEKQVAYRNKAKYEVKFTPKDNDYSFTPKFESNEIEFEIKIENSLISELSVKEKIIKEHIKTLTDTGSVNYILDVSKLLQYFRDKINKYEFLKDKESDILSYLLNSEDLDKYLELNEYYKIELSTEIPTTERNPITGEGPGALRKIICGTFITNSLSIKPTLHNYKFNGSIPGVGKINVVEFPSSARTINMGDKFTVQFLTDNGEKKEINVTVEDIEPIIKNMLSDFSEEYESFKEDFISSNFPYKITVPSDKVDYRGLIKEYEKTEIYLSKDLTVILHKGDNYKYVKSIEFIPSEELKETIHNLTEPPKKDPEEDTKKIISSEEILSHIHKVLEINPDKIELHKEDQDDYVFIIHLGDLFNIKLPQYFELKDKYIFYDVDKETEVILQIEKSSESYKSVIERLKKDIIFIKNINDLANELSQDDITIETAKVEMTGNILPSKNKVKFSDKNNSKNFEADFSREEFDTVRDNIYAYFLDYDPVETKKPNIVPINPNIATEFDKFLSEYGKETISHKVLKPYFKRSGVGNKVTYSNLKFIFELDGNFDNTSSYEFEDEYVSIDFNNKNLTISFLQNICDFSRIEKYVKYFCENLNTSKKESYLESIESLDDIRLEFDNFHYNGSEDIEVGEVRVSIDGNDRGISIKNSISFRLDIEEIKNSIMSDYDEEKYDNIELDLDSIQVNSDDNRFYTVIQSYEPRFNSIIVENGKFDITYKIHNIETDEIEEGTAISNEFDIVESDNFKETMEKFIKALNFINGQ